MVNQHIRILLLLSIFSASLCGNNTLAQNQTEVLVLGTSHLNHIKGFSQEAADPVIDALEKHNFDVVCIESMPTELLNDIASRNDSTYLSLIESRGSFRLEMASKYQSKLGVSFVEGQKRITEILGNDSLSDAKRIELIRCYLAVGELYSAALQYSYLDKDVQINPKDIDSSTVAVLQEYLAYSNESSSIALKLAKKQGHQRVEYIDNLQDEPILLTHFPQFIPDYMKHKELIDSILNVPLFKAIDSLERSCIANNNLVPLYKFYDGNEYEQRNYDAEWKIWLTSTNFESKSDLSRYALWEMRNLQIAANIMKTAAFHPNKRILVIIGASHKSFIDKYLSQSQNIKLLKF